MLKIYLSPSDQSNNIYAYGNTTEKEQCGKIACYLECELNRCGFEVKKNLDDTMYSRVSESNEWGADLHLCIHTNAFNGCVTGTRIYAWNKGGTGWGIATKVFNQLAPITPGTSESINVNTDWYEIVYTHAPCVYIETEFHDVKETAKWIINHTEEIAIAICKGICDYYGVKYIEEQKKNKLYRVQVGAFITKANAEKYRDKLKSFGIPAFIVEANG